MKFALTALALAIPAFGGTITVCNAGCNYTTAQAALNASSNGDTIILTSGQSYGSLTIPGNRHDLTIKSSDIDSYPRGYRITRNHPALARLTTVAIGDNAGWATASGTGTTLTNAPGTTPQPHNFKVGDRVAVGGTTYSAYFCASLNQSPYVDGGCDSTRVGYMNIRTNSGLTNGSVVYFVGVTLPPPLQPDTPYYIVNFVSGGCISTHGCANADKMQLAATPGGTPIFIPQFDPEGQSLTVEVPPMPERMGATMFVSAVPTPNTLQLSETPGGPAVTWMQFPLGNNQNGFSHGFNLIKTAPNYNITFDGIEMAPTSDRGVYYVFYMSRYITSMEGEPHDIRILRCWVHGADDQEDFPYAAINMAGRNLEVGWSIAEGTYSTSGDTQNISFMSTKNVSIHDNELKGATEGIFSGGNYPWFATLTNTTGISVYRNYLWKPLKAYIGIVASYVSPTQFQLLSRFQQADCSSVANSLNLGYRCFAYEAQETPGTATPPSAPQISRTEWTASAAASTFTANGVAGQAGYIYLLGGAIHMDYNFSGAVSCPSGVTCAFVASPSFPTLSTRIGIAAIGSGGKFDSTFFGQNRNVYSKNLIESKYGDNWLIEGNVFHRQNNCDAGVSCQDPAINMTIAINGSGPGDPVDYLVSTSNYIIRNNIFRMLSAGISAVGKSFPGNFGGAGMNWEWVGFGKNKGGRIENNLMMDLGSTEYQAINDGFVVNQGNTEALTVQHNTAVDIRSGFLAGAAKQAIFSSNIVVPYRSACIGYGGCSSPAPSTAIGSQDLPFVLPIAGGNSSNTWVNNVNIGNVDRASQFNNNLMMNRMGVCCITNVPAQYPAGTYLMNVSGADPAALFANWQERSNSLPPAGLNYRASNYRLAPGQAALYPTFDGRAIGADIDEIEALTGRAGIDVENGRPTFAERSARTISNGVTSAVISYLPNGSSCTIEAWPNAAYNGTPVVNTTDSGAAALDGRISLKLSGFTPGTAYYGKRWCGSEVDVFTLTTLTTSASSSTLSVHLAAPGGAQSCAVEYGATPALGSTTTPVSVSGGNCTVAVPAGAAYWRHVYQSSAGTVVGRGNIQGRGL